VVLSVIDSGVGMDEATRQRAFEPFYTTKEPGRGSGLGLSTVYGIVSQCGGAVDISSAPGKGTAVRVYLPAVEAAPAPAEECGARKGSAVRAPRAGTVLLVEDEEAPRRLLHRALTRMGYAVLEARSGEEALSLWHSKRSEIDAVVSDVVMPGMGGPALVERLRAEAPRLPVVFISGYAQGVLPDPAALGDRVTLLEKPFALAALEERLRAVLEA
jgi:CheY-like chemotaxis protein